MELEPFMMILRRLGITVILARLVRANPVAAELQLLLGEVQLVAEELEAWRALNQALLLAVRLQEMIILSRATEVAAEVAVPVVLDMRVEKMGLPVILAKPEEQVLD